jgi:hypothetical protein
MNAETEMEITEAKDQALYKKYHAKGYYKEKHRKKFKKKI